MESREDKISSLDEIQWIGRIKLREWTCRFIIIITGGNSLLMPWRGLARLIMNISKNTLSPPVQY